MQVSGADPAFLIRGDVIQKFSCQILGNYSKESSFLYYQKCLSFLRLYVLPPGFYNFKKLSLRKPVYKNLYLIKKIFYLPDKFLSGFFLRPKLNKALKLNLVLPLDLRL